MSSVKKMSYHAMVERKERIRAIEETLGFTHIVVEWKDYRTNARRCITSSGVVLVKNLEKDFLITAFMGTQEQIERICRKAGKKQVPPKLQKRVEKNLKKYSYLLEIRG